MVYRLGCTTPTRLHRQPLPTPAITCPKVQSDFVDKTIEFIRDAKVITLTNCGLAMFSRSPGMHPITFPKNGLKSTPAALTWLRASP